MSASWPTSVATDSNLYVGVNELQNNLSAGINNAVTTIGINSTTNFPTVGLVLIDNEVIKYTGISGNNLTGCTRGFDGTTAASHSSAAVVSFAICADHHNVLKNEIEAIETYLSNNLGTGSQPLATGSSVLVSSAGGKITESSVTTTTLGFLDATSSIQTQLNAKAPTASPTFSGTITTALTANRALTTGAAGVLAVSATTDTELGYVSGVTSAIQTQLNAKQATLTAGQLPGTATNDAASAGNVGERVSSAVTAVSVPASGGTYGDLTSISLPAGDWDVTLLAVFIQNGASVTDNVIIGISTTSGNSSTGLVLGDNQASFNNGSTTQNSCCIPVYRMSLSGTTTVYAKMRAAGYSGATPQLYGRLSARRVR